MDIRELVNSLMTVAPASSTVYKDEKEQHLSVFRRLDGNIQDKHAENSGSSLRIRNKYAFQYLLRYLLFSIYS